jgi:hypothetical protein
MRSIWFILFTLLSNISFSQISCFNEDIADCKIDSAYQVYDYFNQRTDSLFCIYGRIHLMDCSSFYLKNRKPLYVSRKTTYEDGSGLLEIFTDGNLLFKYYMIKGRIEGIGHIYYPNTGHIAYHGYFVDGKLNGPLFCLSKDNSEVIHAMLFKNGKPKRIVFLWDLVQTTKNYRKINKRKFFKNGQCNGVVEYPFLKSNRKVIR